MIYIIISVCLAIYIFGIICGVIESKRFNITGTFPIIIICMASPFFNLLAIFSVVSRMRN